MSIRTGFGGVRGPRFVPFFQLVWHSGRGWERLFVTLLLTSVVVISLTVAWMGFGVLTRTLPFEVMIGFVLAVTTGGAYLGAWQDALYNARFIKETLHKGWTGPERVAYLEEYVRYVEAFGSNGRFPGDIGWGLLNWGVYYATLVLAVTFTLALLPSLGPSAPYYFFALDVAVALGLFVATGLRNRNKFREAERRGYRLLELHPRRRPTPEKS